MYGSLVRIQHGSPDLRKFFDTSPSSSLAQDTALSRRRRGFESRWGRHLKLVEQTCSTPHIEKDLYREVFFFVLLSGQAGVVSFERQKARVAQAFVLNDPLGNTRLVTPSPYEFALRA
jgi:hypothetical protein